MSLRSHFDKEMFYLHQEVLKMGVFVEQAVRNSLAALAGMDRAAAERVIADDKKIDQFEIAIEDHCIRLIAREQPIATDLRTVITTLKIVSHLERIGDHAVHLAKGVLRIMETGGAVSLRQIPFMADIALRLIPRVLTAFVQKDKDTALQIAREDDKIDTMHIQLIRELLNYMKENTAHIEQAINLLFISRFIERLGDHVVDICEWIVYNASGEHPDLKN